MDRIIESDMDQHSTGYFHAEPCIVRTGSTSIAQPNMCTVVAPTGNTAPFDPRHIPEHYANAMMHRVTRYNAMRHQQNLDLNLYHSGMLAPFTGALPAPLSHGARGQLLASSSYSVAGVGSDNAGSSIHLVDDVRGPCKRKNEGFQYYNASASSSSAVAPQLIRHPDGSAIRDASSFSVPQFRGSSAASLMEAGPQTNLWTRSADSVMVPDNSNLIRGNYMGQCFQPATGPWIDQHLSTNNIDGHNAAWNPSLSVPYVQATNVSRSTLESGNMGLPRYHETANNIGGPRFLPHPPMNQHRHHHGYHPSSLQMQVGRTQNLNFHPHLITNLYGNPSYPTQSTVPPVQNSFETTARHLWPVPQDGTWAYHPNRSGAMIETNLGHHNAARLRVLPSEDVALVELQEYYEAGDLIDHHRDMRLDIDHMSYEELLALGEWIGNVNTGLSEETIMNRLITKTYLAAPTAINLEEAASEELETDSCIICQEEYKNREKIGFLECGHEYHMDCLKKWLLVKNVCPICKKEALTTGKKDVRK